MSGVQQCGACLTLYYDEWDGHQVCPADSDCPAHGPTDDGTCHGCIAEDRAEHQEREGRR